MVYEENINKLKKSMHMGDKPGSGKHTINIAAPFLPFGTRNPERPKFKRKFSGVTGEVVRLINGKELEEDFDIVKSIDNIVEVVKCNNEDDKKYLKELVKEYLIDKDGDIKVFHAKLFNYIELDKGTEIAGEKKIAQFLYDILFSDNNISYIFEENETKNMIIKLVLSKLSGLKERESEKVYINKLDFITDVAKEDFKFLIKHKEFFLKNFQQLIAYYYFYYITQLSIKLNKKGKANFSEVEKIYYLLDWEKASKNRKSVVNGYSLIKAESKNLLINVNVIEHLNFLCGVKGFTYFEILNMINNSSNEEKNSYLSTIHEWIKIYRNNFGQEPVDVELEFEELVNTLEKSLAEKIDQATISRYSLWIEEIGKKYFLKIRGGSYGYMLNMTQEMLLMITAICIKEDKITLKDLFKEYERRGLFLDSYSQVEVIDLLGKLNLINKKSDSGDAQYVKSIL